MESAPTAQTKPAPARLAIDDRRRLPAGEPTLDQAPGPNLALHTDIGGDDTGLPVLGELLHPDSDCRLLEAALRLGVARRLGPGSEFGLGIHGGEYAAAGTQSRAMPF